jgi:FixJ family two-component response regulator/tetratricopeptide (TPR) repeat protein
MSKAKIAILEDDNTLAAALKAAFERVGHEVYVSSQGTEILKYLETNHVTTLFVDCLLPEGSGVDFVQSLRPRFNAASLDVIMMSGIFTDQGFVKETMRSTQAVTFLKKPFNLPEALNCIRTHQDLVDVRQEISPRKQLYSLFRKSKVTVREKRKAIEALEEIHGFDLPYIYSLMVETEATGHLNIVNAKGDVSGVSFSAGKIIGVDIVDKDTQLGRLLIETGYILADDLNEALAEQSVKKIGERLIDKNLLSPHAFDIALTNQMSIRLSRTIIDASVKVNFIVTDVPLTFPQIDSEALSAYLHDWIASKISFDWLKAHYTSWGEYSIHCSPSFDEKHPILKMPLVSRVSGFVAGVTDGSSLAQLIEMRKWSEEFFFKALHLLLTKGVLVFSETPAVINEKDRVKFLQKVMSQFQGKNKYQSWDLIVRMVGTPDLDPAEIYQAFVKLIGETPGDNVDSQLRDAISHAQNFLRKVSDEAYQFSQSGNKEKAIEEQEKNEFEKKMQASRILEESRLLMSKSQYTQGLDLLHKAGDLDPNIGKLQLYLIWAKLGQLNEKPQGKQNVLSEVESALMQVPPEEKFDALYSFVMGLFHKHRGEIVPARKSLEKAYAMDNSLIMAKRELAMINSQMGQKKDVFNADLKDLVSGFFKKK